MADPGHYTQQELSDLAPIRHKEWEKARDGKDYIYADQIRAGLIALNLFNPNFKSKEASWQQAQ